MKYYLAVDIGASSGRHILAHLEDGKIVLEEMYRFTNGNVTRDGHLCWELDRLFEEIVNGIAACAKAGKAPSSMGIDTWGVDFVLLDKNNQILGDTIAYRDSRTDDMDKLLETMISPEELYERTGIQKQLYNSIYQLLAIKNEHPEYIKNAEHYLMVPEYFNYLLTGVMMNEYTNATTGQLVNAVTKDWDYELLDRIGIPSKIFGKLHMPKTSVGMLKPEIAKKCGCHTEVDVILLDVNGAHGVGGCGIHGKGSMIFMSKSSDLTNRIQYSCTGLIMSSMYQSNVRVLLQGLLHFF